MCVCVCAFEGGGNIPFTGTQGVVC